MTAAARINELENTLAAREAELAKLKAIFEASQTATTSSQDQSHVRVIMNLEMGLTHLLAKINEKEDNAILLIQMIEKRAEEAEAQAKTAVADFRASEEFKKEKLDFSLEAFKGGVKSTQKRVMDRYLDLDWGFLYEEEDFSVDEDLPPIE